MKRTAEKVLSIISLVFTVIAIIVSFVVVAMARALTTDSALRHELEMDLYADPNMSMEDVELFMSFFNIFEGFSWFIVIVLVISLIATIIGIVFMWNNKNPKLAGILFIVAGLFAFVLSPTSIMLYVAAILCFTRKPEIPPAGNTFVEENYDDTMRPL